MVRPHKKCKSVLKDVRSPALQPFTDLLHRLQRGALLTIFEAEKAGTGDAQLVGEWGVSLITTLFTKKFSQIFVQRCPHKGILDESAFL
jgi:hypothetical protein